jgi:hypothetical protein
MTLLRLLIGVTAGHETGLHIYVKVHNIPHGRERLTGIVVGDYSIF